MEQLGTVRPGVEPDGEEDAPPGQDHAEQHQQHVLEENLSVWESLREGNDQNDVLELGDAEDGEVLVRSYWRRINFWITTGSIVRVVQLLAKEVFLRRGVEVARIVVIELDEPRLGSDKEEAADLEADGDDDLTDEREEGDNGDERTHGSLWSQGSVIRL